MTKSDSVWAQNPQMDVVLCRCAEEGLTTQQIATALNRQFGCAVTRNAIVSRARRIGAALHGGQQRNQRPLMSWDDSKDDMLRDLAMRGKTGKEIAKAIGYPCTTGAVTARASLMEISLAGHVHQRSRKVTRGGATLQKLAQAPVTIVPEVVEVRQPKPRQRTRPSHSQRFNPTTTFKPELQAPTPVESNLPIPLDRTLEQLDSSHCHWPLGLRAPYAFCGHRVHRKKYVNGQLVYTPYCHYHDDVAHGRTRDPHYAQELEILRGRNLEEQENKEEAA